MNINDAVIGVRETHFMARHSSFKKICTLSTIVISALTLQACSSGGGSGESFGPGAPGDWVSTKPGPVASRSDYKPYALSDRLFESGSSTYVAMDISTYILDLVFKPSSQSTTGKATITFNVMQAGRPYLLLGPTASSVKLNGASVETSRVSTPGGDSALVIDRNFAVGETGVLEIQYSLPSDRVSYTSNGVGFLTDMADTINKFFERYGPANFENDQFQLTMNLKVDGSSKQHRLFANGTVVQNGTNNWTVAFPSTYTSSSIFAHLTDRQLTVENFSVQGSQRSIPITIYGADSSLVSQAKSRIPGLVREIERDYGPYPHTAFIAYMGRSSGGMEFAGATITSLKSLSHELFHSWFARGVMPAEGRAGWIDEAIASWRDYGSSTASSLLSRGSTKLASQGAFSRATPTNSYADGRALMAEFNLLLKDQGGLKPFLKEFAQNYRFAVITTGEFKRFLEARTGKDLSDFFERYVTTNDSILNDGGEDSGEEVGENNPDDIRDSFHPTPLTQEEIEELR